MENNIKYVDLDKGNISDIDKSVNDYKYGDAKILLSNSTLFGCGMNFENSTDIIFVHKMNEDMEKQVIGRAQRMGRKSALNIIYLHYENESEYVIRNSSYSSFYSDTNKSSELEGYYNEQQYFNLINNIQNLDFDENNTHNIDNIGTNEIDIFDNCLTSMEDLTQISIPELSHGYIDNNLDEFISNLDSFID